MINIISSIALLVISVSQLNIFEIDGVFSSAHVRSIERHIDETQYSQNDLLVIQYSSTKYSEKAVSDFEKLIINQDFVKAITYGKILYFNFRTNFYVYVLCPRICAYWS